jgi:hypothetical protein
MRRKRMWIQITFLSLNFLLIDVAMELIHIHKYDHRKSFRSWILLRQKIIPVHIYVSAIFLFVNEARTIFFSFVSVIPDNTF